MTQHRIWRAGLHLLDHQIVACDGYLAGNVDDLELEQLDDGRIVVTALLSGGAAWARRIEGRLGAAIESIEDRLAEQDTPSRIDFALVGDVDSVVTLTTGREGLETNRAEQWTRDHVIGHIPGARHAPE